MADIFGRLAAKAQGLGTLAGTFRRYRRWGAAVMGIAATGLLAACSGMSFPDFGSGFPPMNQPASPQIQGRSIGNGPVTVALLLPLSGDVATVGTSMANAAQMAMDYIQSNPNLADNITLVLKDTASNAPVASQQASQAVAEGAKLILGPLKADSVQAAGSAARSAGVPMIGFSNNSGAAAPGVYLLNVLPEVEIQRSLGYIRTLGKQSIAALIPSTDYGRIQEAAFRQVAANMGINVRAVYNYSTAQDAQNAVNQVAPFVQQGAIDTLFIPDAPTASNIGLYLEQAGIDRNKVTVVGSTGWDNNDRVKQTNFLIGAIYPAVDDSGLNALRPDYQARFGGEPHPFTTLVYTAVLLANAQSLALAQPPYPQSALTNPRGFTGRDGLFRFNADGTSVYALAIKQISVGSAQQVQEARLP